MDQFRPELHVIAGPNGSGKTTVTQKLLASAWGKNVVYINPDEIAQKEFSGWNDSASVKKAADLAEKRRRAALADRMPVAFETVFSTREKVQFIVDAKAAGFFVRVFFIGTARPEINVGRIAMRIREGGHAVPTDKIFSRYTKSIANAAIVAAHIDRFYLYDNSIDSADARLVFRANDGVLAKRYGDIPAWSKAVFETLASPQ